MLSTTRLTSTALATALSLSAAAWSPNAAACGSESYLGTVCTFGFNFCPRGWTEAGGQLLPIAQNQALFALLGTQFGGNGQTTFALPDLRGRAVIGTGQGPGLSSVIVGQVGGQENVTLTQAQMPAHTHTAQVKGTASTGNTDSPTGAVPARLPRSNIYSNGGGSDATMATTVTIGTAGGSAPVNVRNPYLGMTTCIALQGIFPSRN
jgi:microcystin-dependent protein